MKNFLLVGVITNCLIMAFIAAFFSAYVLLDISKLYGLLTITSQSEIVFVYGLIILMIIMVIPLVLKKSIIDNITLSICAAVIFWHGAIWGFAYIIKHLF